MHMIGFEFYRERILGPRLWWRDRLFAVVPRWGAVVRWDRPLLSALQMGGARYGPLLMETYLGRGSLCTALRNRRNVRRRLGPVALVLVVRPAVAALALVLSAALGAWGGAVWLAG